MRRSFPWTALAVGLALAITNATNTARAGEPADCIQCSVCGRMHCIGKHEHKGDINHFFHQEPQVDKAASARYYADHTHCRAGYPLSVSAHAYQTKSPYEVGYFVGGNGAFHGFERGCQRQPVGTWGWDYNGILLPVCNRLKWVFGSHRQPDHGSYQSAGHPIPDVFATDYHYHFHGAEEE